MKTFYLFHNEILSLYISHRILSFLDLIFSLYKIVNQSDLKSINELMVENGYAWKYDGGTKQKNLQELLDIRNSRGNSNGI